MSVASCQSIERPVAQLRPYARNAGTHSKMQIKQIAASITRFGLPPRSDPIEWAPSDESLCRNRPLWSLQRPSPDGLLRHWTQFDEF